MSFDYSRLTEIEYIAGAAASHYTNPSSTISYARIIILHNTDTVNQTVTLYNVPDNAGSVGTAGVTNQFFTQTLTAGTTLWIPIEIPGLILEDENDSIQAVCGTADKVTIQIYGGIET